MSGFGGFYRFRAVGSQQVAKRGCRFWLILHGLSWLPGWPVGAALPADCPDLLREPATPQWRSFMDHFAAGVMRASSVALGSGNVFSKRLGTRIELPGSSS